MTKQEIKEAIAKGIAGQGTNVDGGGYLPKILEAIVDAIPEGGASPIAPEPTIVINWVSFEDVDETNAADQLGITVDELRALPNQSVVKTIEGYVLTRTLYNSSANGDFDVIFGGQELNNTLGRCVYLQRKDGEYTIIAEEV